MAGGKTYQVTQVDPLNPHTKGMVYQVNIVGGGTQMEELPEASADNVGQVYQYLGETGSGLTHGFFYESQALGTTPETYGWVAVNVQQGGATNSATTDMSNLTVTGANISNWSTNVSNCITEIPQDIKLELNNGTLTLKSGSKVYIPNGAGVFNSETTTVDITHTNSNNGTFILYKNPGNYINYQAASTMVSGATDSLAGTPWHIWYDTTNNVINRYLADGTTPNPGQSFPIAVYTVSGGAISSIDRVFNGFGYIGKTIFGLPGVKALIPNGRNTDGTLKSIVRDLDKVYTADIGGDYTERQLIISNFTARFGTQTNTAYYNPETNFTMTGATPDTATPVVLLGTIKTYAGIINYFEINTTPFRAVDYSDTEFIAHQAMPSSRYVNLTLPASGGTVTAPADGYFALEKVASAAGQNAYFKNNTTGLAIAFSAADIMNARIFVPVSKGGIISVNYSLSGTTSYFRFIYANGSK